MRPSSACAGARMVSRNSSRPRGGQALGLECQLQAFGLVGVGHGGDLRGTGAHHQRVAASRVDIDDAAVLNHRIAAGIAHQLRDQLVAAVEHVRRHAGGVFADDAVDLRHFRCQPVDLGGAGDQAVVDLVAQRFHLRGHALEAADQRVGAVQHAAAVGGAGSVGRQAVDRIEEVGPHAGQVGGAVREQGIDAVGPCRKLLQARQFTTAVEQPRDRQLVGDAAHVGDHRAVADPGVTGVGGRARGEIHLLPAVALGLDVGDVVAGSRQCTLEGEQGVGTGGQNAGHGRLPQRRTRPDKPVALAKD